MDGIEEAQAKDPSKFFSWCGITYLQGTYRGFQSNFNSQVFGSFWKNIPFVSWVISPDMKKGYMDWYGGSSWWKNIPILKDADDLFASGQKVVKN